MKQISVMIKPASSLCNMRCRYCFYADVSSLRSVDSFGIMERDTTDRILEHIFADLEKGDRLTLAFQGGEPTLAGLDYFRHVSEAAAPHQSRGVQVQYALQTNGLLLDEEWCRFLHEQNYLVGLSLDGPALYHDANRPDAQQKGTFRRVMAAKHRLDMQHVEYNVLMVLTNQMARHPQQIWRFIEEQDLRYVQFTPCMGPLEGADGSYILTPSRYAGFYNTIFDLWCQCYYQGRYRSIKLFDDLVSLLAFGECNACGLLGRCQPQIIVEADGSVYPCDFYVLDSFRTGNLREDSLRNVYESPIVSDFLRRPKEPLSLCEDCPYRKICGGGCQRMRREVFYAPGDKECGHRLFLDSCIGRLQRLADEIRRQ